MIFDLSLILMSLSLSLGNKNTNVLFPKVSGHGKYDLLVEDFTENKTMIVKLTSFNDGRLKFENLWFKEKETLDWWQKEVIYQVYPRSFKDTNGDGIGDLRGIIQSIPYLKDIGVGAIWISPIYPSPGVDTGYDISDFKQIDSIFGSMDDFDEMISKLHDNDIKLILDFVPNHTSDKHEWFLKSEQKIEPYTDYYVWADPKYKNKTKRPPNNWVSLFDHRMWEWSEMRQQYYLHQSCVQQPDLNYWNQNVRNEMTNVLRYWLDKGVDGFRVDTIALLYEIADLRDAPPDPLFNYTTLMMNGFTRNLPETFEMLTTWRSVVDEYKQKDGKTRCLFVECYEMPDILLKYYGNATNPGSHFPLFPYLLFLNHVNAHVYAYVIGTWFTLLTSKRWANWIIGNHDLPRPTTRIGPETIDALHMMQMLLPGTPITYYGDELGMPSTYLRKDQIVDSMVVHFNGESFIRDISRTPFQWDSTAQAGFSNKTKTWLPVHPNYITVNVESENNAMRSHLKIFKDLVNLRKLNVFRTGHLSLYEISKYVFGFSRREHTKIFFIVINLGSEVESINLKTVKRTLPNKMKVRVASLFAEQYKGEIISTKSFTLRPCNVPEKRSKYFYTRNLCI